MSELEWYPHYAADWLTSRKRRRLTWAQQGVYAALLDEEWVGGPLSLDTVELARSIGAEHGDVIAVLSSCFDETKAGWINGVLEDVRTEQLAKLDAHRRAGRAGAKAKWRKALNVDGDAIAPPLATSKRRSSSRVEESRVEKKETARRTRVRKTPTDCPPDWKPNEGHATRAAASKLDCGKEAAKFRAWHEAKGNTFASWDAAFTTWLLKATEFAAAAPPPDSEAAQWDREAEAWRDKKRMVDVRTAGEIKRLTVPVPKLAG